MSLKNSTKIFFCVLISGCVLLFGWYSYNQANPLVSEIAEESALTNPSKESVGSVRLYDSDENRNNDGPLTPLNANERSVVAQNPSVYLNAWTDEQIKSNKARIELELENLELALAASTSFDIHYSFEVVAGRCASRSNFPPKYQPSETQFARLVESEQTLDTQQARRSYYYVNGFYQRVCEAVGPLTARRLGAQTRVLQKANQDKEVSTNQPVNVAALLNIAYSSASISETSIALHKMAASAKLSWAEGKSLFSQKFMRSGDAMPALVDRVDDRTLELVALQFYCKSRPDECASGTYFTIISCELFYTCAPGLDAKAYWAMRYSPDRILAASQMADALIEERRLRSGVRRRN
jgi:hypothetical protein